MPPMKVKNMCCFDCGRLRLEHQRATEAYLEIIHMFEKDAHSLSREEPEIWDFILDVAVRAREDAERALENHQKKHKLSLVYSASMILLALFERNLWAFSEELLTVF
jgi:hypothetical protein